MNNCKILYQYDIEGNFIKKWNSFAEVSFYFGFKNSLSSSMKSSINKNKPYRNCFWSKIYYIKHPISKIKNDDEKLYRSLIRNHNDGKIILQFTKNGEFVNEYIGLSKLAREMGVYPGNIRQSLKGRKKTFRGFVWKYKD